jgi:hypothetical protein
LREDGKLYPVGHAARPVRALATVIARRGGRLSAVCHNLEISGKFNHLWRACGLARVSGQFLAPRKCWRWRRPAPVSGWTRLSPKWRAVLFYLAADRAVGRSSSCGAGPSDVGDRDTPGPGVGGIGGGSFQSPHRCTGDADFAVDRCAKAVEQGAPLVCVDRDVNGHACNDGQQHQDYGLEERARIIRRRARWPSVYRPLCGGVIDTWLGHWYLS